MNETQYYSATIHGEEVIGRNVGSRFYGIDRNGKLYGEDAQINLTPVKFVPQDAVVVEGVTAEDIIEIVKVLLKGFGVFNSEVARKILLQLTPPKPRPEEPKGFGAVVEADCLGDPPTFPYRKRCLFSFDGKYWREKGFMNRAHYYSDLIDPVVLSEGQVK